MCARVYAHICVSVYVCSIAYIHVEDIRPNKLYMFTLINP